MALRSGLETEAIWAINALNVLLYDDTNPHPCLTQMPGLLNVIIEHFWATLSVLYPETFPLGEPSVLQIPEGNYDVLRLPFLTNGNAHEEVKQPVATRNPEKKKNYNKCSRTGRKIKVLEMEMPEQLKRKLMLEEGPSSLPVDDTLTSEYVEERVKVGLGGGLAERVAYSNFKRSGEHPEHNTEWGLVNEVKNDAEEVSEILLLRRDRPNDSPNQQLEFEIRWPRSTALACHDETLQRFALRALGLIKHPAWTIPSAYGHRSACTTNESAPKIDVDAPLPEPESYDVVKKRALSLLDADDTRELLLVETANQLRDDAFVMLCHMSVALDLYDVPDRLSYPIYDGILHWCSTSVPEATDPITPGRSIPTKLLFGNNMQNVGDGAQCGYAGIYWIVATDRENCAYVSKDVEYERRNAQPGICHSHSECALQRVGSSLLCCCGTITNNR
ncbi:hypothetical protein KIN20_023484 [Parelaphostrongylus tenuis]|uniref:SWI/SNF-like complex subunit BAF250 C-terminal domain-containing protein n=1 Tax=Parelaphostrongylus tenuis TaxID=148309 RepID=A0AAD5N936_PARTN|nr:hypothetical protein KIN20_023484 [Parelaphostrongylus tenuis]